jgi:hypothetical protein
MIFRNDSYNNKKLKTLPYARVEELPEFGN